MGATGAVSQEDTTDIYKNQLKYNKYIENKKRVYSFICLIAAIVNVVALFAFPMFKYSVKGNSRTGVKPIKGEFTHIYIIQKYFRNELGERSAFNVAYMIFLFALIALMIYLVAATGIAAFAHNLVKQDGMMKNLFGYVMIEILATVFLVVLLFAMMCGKIDVSGNAENAPAFWIYAVTSIVMIFTSIPLSDK